MLGEYLNITLMCAMMTILFLGGWHAAVRFVPFTWVPGRVLVRDQGGSLFFMFAMVKALVPRYRYDQLMRLGWKVFLPTSLAAGWAIVVGGVSNAAFGLRAPEHEPDLRQ
jgi:NADH-quinone oxidoreductase subunit H